MNEDVDQKERVAKRIVIILGVLLTLCFVIVIGIIAYRLATKSAALPADKPLSVTESSGNGAASIVDIPAGTRVVSVTEEGANYLVVVSDGKADLLLVVDRASGETIKTIQFRPRASSRPGE